MQVEEVIRARHSVRSYTNFAPSNSDIQKVLDAANRAPSAGGLGARNLLVFRRGSRTEGLASAAGNQDFIAEAPYVMVFCADLKRIEPYGERGRELYCIQDTAASAENAILMACDLGIGSCWVGAFDPEAVKELLGLPDHMVPQVILPLGYEK